MASAHPPSVAPRGPQQVTRKEFLLWHSHVRLRQVQKEYTQLEQEARQCGCTVPEMMKKKNYRSAFDFEKRCDLFPLQCSAHTLAAEIGSGAALYFYFLRGLGILFCLFLVLTIPHLIVYSGENWLMGWQWNDWKVGYFSGDPCKCVENNNDILGLDGFPDQKFYGHYCRAWDNDTGVIPCSANAKCRSPGRWACRKWCFASSDCSTKPNPRSPSLTNVHFHDLVRSYSYCARPADEVAVQAACQGPLSADVEFNESGATFGVRNSIGSHWMTPGNFGPHMAEVDWPPRIYVALVFFVGLFGCLGHLYMVWADIGIDEMNTSPNDFAMLVSGLPRDSADEDALAKWFRENALKKQLTDIVKVVIAWDAEDYRERIKKLSKLSKELQTLDHEAHKVKVQDIDKRMGEVAAARRTSPEGQPERLRSSGTAVVIFRHQDDMRKCVRRFSSFWARWLYFDASPVRFFCTSCSARGMPLPMYDGHRIRVERAPNPGDIHWMDLGVDWQKRYWRLAQTYTCMAALIAVTFVIVYLLNVAADTWRKEGRNNKDLEEPKRLAFQGFAVIAALVVVIMNLIMTTLARKLAQHEYHDTLTEEEFAQAEKITVGTLINTAGVIYFLHTTPNEWYQPGGLVDKAFYLLIADVAVTLLPLCPPLNDPVTWATQRWKRRKLTDQMLKRFTEVIGRVSTKRDASQQEKQELKQVVDQINYFKREAYSPPEMDYPTSYASALQSTFYYLFFGPIFPIVVLLAIAKVILQYIVDKYALLRIYKRPTRPTNSSMALHSMRTIQCFGPLMLTFSSFVFLTPSWKDKSFMYAHLGKCLAISFGWSVLPTAWVGIVVQKCRSGKRRTSTEDYYDAQHKWSREMKYHKDQFMYAELPESVNPEFLTDKTKAVSRDDIAKQRAAGDSAEAARARWAHRPVLPGGRMLFNSADDTCLEMPGGGGGSRSVPPMCIGVRPSTSSQDSEPRASVHSKGSRGIVAPTDVRLEATTLLRPVWEFEDGDGWSFFPPGEQEFIEGRYNEYRTMKKAPRRTVRVGGAEFTFDFIEMKQTNKATDVECRIRRTSPKEVMGLLGPPSVTQGS